MGKIGRLELLPKLGVELVIPAAVWREVVEMADGRPPGAWMAANFRAAIREGDVRLTRAYAAQVDQGEAEALAIAASVDDACLLMDDARGRAIAKANGFRFVGTLGVLVEARRRGLVGFLKPELDALQEAGWHISAQLVREALDLFGE